MMKPNTILAAILLSGSASVWAAPAPVSEVGDASPNSLEARLAVLEKMMRTRNQLQVNIQQQLTLLQDEVSQLRGETEEQGYQLQKILQRQRELYQEIEERVAAAQQPVTPSIPVSTLPEDVTGPVSVSLSENEAYDRAVNLILKDKRYDQAIPEFANFLKNFPESAYVSNAHYWLGQLLFNKEDYSAARVHFEAVVNQHTDSSKRPDAMLKLGTLLQKLNLAAQAENILKQLVQEYPNSTAAQLAKVRKNNQ